MKKFLLIIAAIFCCTIGANAQETPDYFCLTFHTTATVSGRNITFYRAKSSWTIPSLEYKINNGEWTKIEMGSGSTSVSTPTLNDGDKVYIRATGTGEEGNKTFSESTTNYFYMYTTTGNTELSVSGNIMSLLDRDNFENLDLVPRYAFCKLFGYSSNYSKKITDVSHLRLPATKMSNGCYSFMFAYCSQITTAPALPATALADSCYTYMFGGCSSLNDAPTLPATELKKYCYANMFNACSSLKSMEVGIKKWPVNDYVASQPDDYRATNLWVSGDFSKSGTFICPDDLPEEHGSGRIPEGWTVEHPTNYITLNDNEPYTGTKDKTATVTYNRHFEEVMTDSKNPVFYPLYVPFDIEITSELLEKCEILDIYMVSAGSDKDVLNAKAMKEGKTKFHTPYIIIPKVADLSFTQENTVVHGINAVQNPVQCATTKDTYDFIGNYAGETLTVGTDFILTTTKLLPVDEDTKTLAPNRWYMKKTSKMGENASSVDLKEMNIVVFGEGGATGIEGVSLTPALSTREGVTYNLQGQRVGSVNGYRGIVIKGGKKFIVK